VPAAPIVTAAVLLATAGALSPAVASSPAAQDRPAAEYRVGDTGPGGGVVFYDAGTRAGWGRYLEVAPAGWSGATRDPLAPWCPQERPGHDAPVPTGTAIGTGRANTQAIIAACGGRTAAGVAARYRGGGRTDWFLPSTDELAALYDRARRGSADRGRIGLRFALVWSSTQHPRIVDGAWAQTFTTGETVGDLKSSAMKKVRPIRAF